jgi:hypothetical protein
MAFNPLFASVAPGKLICPKCGAPEIHPDNTNLALVRWFKVYSADGTEWSQCLVCAGYYTKFLSVLPEFLRPGNWQERGWFSGTWVSR